MPAFVSLRVLVLSSQEDSVPLHLQPFLTPLHPLHPLFHYVLWVLRGRVVHKCSIYGWVVELFSALGPASAVTSALCGEKLLSSKLAQFPSNWKKLLPRRAPLLFSSPYSFAHLHPLWIGEKTPPSQGLAGWRGFGSACSLFPLGKRFYSCEFECPAVLLTGCDPRVWRSPLWVLVASFLKWRNTE